MRLRTLAHRITTSPTSMMRGLFPPLSGHVFKANPSPCTATGQTGATGGTRRYLPNICHLSEHGGLIDRTFKRAEGRRLGATLWPDRGPRRAEAGSRGRERLI